MDERVKKLWVEALRSGRYIQGKGFLRQVVDGKPKDCCLGVLCDLYAAENPADGEWVEPDVLGAAYMFQTPTDSNAAELPIEVQEWAGLNNANPYLGETTAAQWNDGEELLEGERPATFADIANMIEAYL